jgi:predicted small metal-binding protein
MSQIEVWASLFCVRCADVGLDCDSVISENSEKKVMQKTIMHMFEHHAINPEEMTTCMRLKIRENILIDERTYGHPKTSELPFGVSLDVLNFWTQNAVVERMII